LNLLTSILAVTFAVLSSAAKSAEDESVTGWICAGKPFGLPAQILIFERKIVFIQDDFLISTDCDNNYVCGTTGAEKTNGVNGSYYTVSFKIEWDLGEEGVLNRPQLLTGFFNEFEIEDGIVAHSDSVWRIESTLNCKPLPSLGPDQNDDQ